jgi:hypothetical protein
VPSGMRPVKLILCEHRHVAGMLKCQNRTILLLVHTVDNQQAETLLTRREPYYAPTIGRQPGKWQDGANMTRTAFPLSRPRNRAM